MKTPEQIQEDHEMLVMRLNAIGNELSGRRILKTNKHERLADTTLAWIEKLVGIE